MCAGARVSCSVPAAHAAAGPAVHGRRHEVWRHDGGRRRRRLYDDAGDGEAHAGLPPSGSSPSRPSRPPRVPGPVCAPLRLLPRQTRTLARAEERDGRGGGRACAGASASRLYVTIPATIRSNSAAFFRAMNGSESGASISMPIDGM